MIRHSPLKILSLIVASLVMGISCGEEKLTGPVDRSVDIAGKPSGGGGPTVTAAVPNTAPQDTTLDVTVSGTGFDRGSRVDLELDGVVSPKVRTNSTRFVNKTTLVANISIAADADPDLYDVAVTTIRGKRGIGIELFEVSYAMTSLGALPGHDQSQAVAISESGDITGDSGRSQPSDGGIFFLSGGVMQEVGTGYAIAASDNQRIVGNDPPSVWERVGGVWANTPLPLLPGMIHQGQNIAPDGTAIVGVSGEESVIWRESGGTWTIEMLPVSCPCDINAAGMIVGHDSVWTFESGTWIPQVLPPFPGGSEVMGWALNDHGDVAGWDEEVSQGDRRRALLWRKTPTSWAPPEYLGSFGGYSSAGEINNAGQVVGYAEVPDQPEGSFPRQHAFVWMPADGMVDLGSRDTDSVAWDINDLGQIVGASRKAAGGNRGGNYTAVLWELQ